MDGRVKCTDAHAGKLKRRQGCIVARRRQPRHGHGVGTRGNPVGAYRDVQEVATLGQRDLMARRCVVSVGGRERDPRCGVRSSRGDRGGGDSGRNRGGGYRVSGIEVADA